MRFVEKLKAWDANERPRLFLFVHAHNQNVMYRIFLSVPRGTSPRSFNEECRQLFGNLEWREVTLENKSSTCMEVSSRDDAFRLIAEIEDHYGTCFFSVSSM